MKSCTRTIVIQIYHRLISITFLQYTQHLHNINYIRLIKFGALNTYSQINVKITGESVIIAVVLVVVRKTIIFYHRISRPTMFLMSLNTSSNSMLK